MQNPENPKCTVLIITYNHRKFIEQNLSSVLGQITNFNFEIIIHDDASTDGTREFIQTISKKYPSKIFPILQSENQISQKKDILPLIFPYIKSKYVALCEGDDYWTDPCKLQKQVDFLDAHPDFSIVFHPVKMLWEQGEHHSGYWGPTENEKTHLDKVIWEKNVIPTLSVMYRWRLSGKDISLWPYGVAPGDWYLHLLHSQVGKIGFIPEEMGVYRKHPGGIWYYENVREDFFTRYFWSRIYFCQHAKAQFNKDFTFIEAELLFNLFNFCIKRNDYSLLYKLRKENKEKWQNLYKNVKKYLSSYPSDNLFLYWLRYKLSCGQNRKKYKECYKMNFQINFLKKQFEKINRELYSD